ncbi:MAG: hypothetical protein ACI9IP_002976 [Arcticibacterium sp.]|jgi:hypothetical protein
MKNLIILILILISSTQLSAQFQKKADKQKTLQMIKSSTEKNSVSEHSTGNGYSLILQGSIFPQSPTQSGGSTTNPCINGGDPTTPNATFSQVISVSDGVVGDKF